MTLVLTLTLLLSIALSVKDFREIVVDLEKIILNSHVIITTNKLTLPKSDIIPCVDWLETQFDDEGLDFRGEGCDSFATALWVDRNNPPSGRTKIAMLTI
ncbi:MAG: hypothetical protein VKL59_24770 [Nostocaceae cyanobacterium]|nr:hypothetical protein [Nostocaceae cyanobacterium]